MTDVHIGRNIRAIRLLLGIKQEAFARKLGISQQNVSRLEKRKKITPSRLKAAATALGVSVDAIERFDENRVLLSPQTVPDLALSPVKEVIEYFKQEIAKRDQLIDQLRGELKRFLTG